MKGYVVLAVLISAFVLLLPPIMLNEQSLSERNETAQEEGVSIRHTDEETYTTMNIDQFVLYETAAQIAYNAPVEAIKAQAVACYTLIRYRQLHGGTVESTCRSFPSCYTEQYWKDTFGADYDKAITAYQTAIAEVKNKCIVYDNQPIMALSHTINGGSTENADVLLGQPLPYLTAVASAADAVSAESSKMVTLSKAEAIDRLTAFFGTAPPADSSTWFGVSEKTQAGTVKTIPVCGQPQTGYTVQTLFSLPSASFDVAVQGELLVFTVRGQGHLVGMSTCGAVSMATDGQTYEQILRHYYTGVVIQ